MNITLRMAAMLMASSLTAGMLQAADMTKTLKLVYPAGATGFDPAKVSDSYSNQVNENIFDTLLTYDYLARPAKLIPNTVESLPEITNNGKTYTFKIKPGIYYSDDPAFKGNKRELVAADYVYSFKRILDKTINSPMSYLLAGKLEGTDELVNASGQGALNYDTEIEGIRALDKYTLQLNLKEVNYNFSYVLAMPIFSAVAKEAIEAYADNTNAHPVGTGPYMLKEWKPGNKIVLTANPNYRKVMFDSVADTKDDIAVMVAKDLKGKQIPAVGQIEISIIEEEQPTWLAFMNKQLDLSGIPQPALKDALDINPENPLDVKLSDSLVKQGISLQRSTLLEITFQFFNMDDPVVGGYTPEKIALRRAVAMAFPRNKTIANIRRGQAIPVKYMIPDGVAGHNPNIDSSVKYDPAKANALLDLTGYKIGADGYRTLPDGSPLIVEYGSGTSAINREWNEYWQQAFDSLKIKLEYKFGKWPELAKENREGKLQMWGLAWGADYPDGDNFMQLAYGPNKGDSNYSRFDLPEFNKLFEASLLLPNGPERQTMYDKMNKLITQYQPIIYGDTRVRSMVTHDYVKGYYAHPLMTSWRYIDIQK